MRPTDTEGKIKIITCHMEISTSISTGDWIVAKLRTCIAGQGYGTIFSATISNRNTVSDEGGRRIRKNGENGGDTSIM